MVNNWLSRVDLCLDLPGQGIAPLKSTFNASQYASLAKRRRSGSFDGHGETFMFGEYPLQMRVYDKIARLGSKPASMEMMRVRRWGGLIPDAATRIEFQVNREALKKRGIGTVEDYFAKRADLAFFLTTRWFRLLVREPTSGNQTRAPVLPLWEKIRRGFMGWAGTPTGKPLKPLLPPTPDNVQLAKQVVGLLLLIMASEKQSPPTKKTMLKRMVGIVEAVLPYDWPMRMEQKRLAIAEHASAFVIPSGPLCLDQPKKPTVSPKKSL